MNVALWSESLGKYLVLDSAGKPMVWITKEELRSAWLGHGELQPVKVISNFLDEILEAVGKACGLEEKP